MELRFAVAGIDRDRVRRRHHSLVPLPQLDDDVRQVLGRRMLPGKDDIGVTSHSRGGVLDEHLDRMETEGDEYMDDFRQAVVPGSDQAIVRLFLVGVGLYVLIDQPFSERQILSADGGNERARLSSAADFRSSTGSSPPARQISCRWGHFLNRSLSGHNDFRRTLRLVP